MYCIRQWRKSLLLKRLLFESTSHLMLVTGIHLAKIHHDLEQNLGMGGEAQWWQAASWRLMALIQVGFRDGSRRQKLSWVFLTNKERYGRTFHKYARCASKYSCLVSPFSPSLTHILPWRLRFTRISALRSTSLEIYFKFRIYGEYHTSWLKCS